MTRHIMDAAPQSDDPEYHVNRDGTIQVAIAEDKADRQLVEVWKAIRFIERRTGEPVIHRRGSALYFPLPNGRGAKRAVKADVDMLASQFFYRPEGKLKLHSAVHSTMRDHVPEDFSPFTGTTHIPMLLPDRDDGHRLLVEPGYDRETGLYVTTTTPRMPATEGP